VHHLVKGSCQVL